MKHLGFYFSNSTRIINPNLMLACDSVFQNGHRLNKIKKLSSHNNFYYKYLLRAYYIIDTMQSSLHRLILIYFVINL